MKRQKSILIVEDEPLLGEIIREMLDPHYEEVIFCNSSLEAKELIKSRPFSLILSDVMMPGLSGDQFVTFLRSLGRIEPVIFVTGNATRDLLLNAIRLGIADIIEKPFVEATLLMTVDRTLEIDKRRMTLYESLFSNVESLKTESQKKMIGLLQVASTKK